MIHAGRQLLEARGVIRPQRVALAENLDDDALRRLWVHISHLMHLRPTLSTMPQNDSGAKLGIKVLLDGLEDVLEGCIGLLIRQRLVLRLELQVEGQALLALRDMLARVDVEQRDTLEVLAAILRDDALDVGRGDALIDDDGEVTRDGRVLRQRLEVEALARVLHEYLECPSRRGRPSA